MYFDPLYMMILLVTLALSGGVSMLVKSRFAAGQKVNISSGLTGADVAKAIIYCVEQDYETGQAIPVAGGQVMLH